MITANKRLVVIICTIFILLLIPFTAMQFTSEVKWSAFDFLVAAILLSGTGILIETVLRKVKTTMKRLLLCGGILLVLLLVWVELAVGIFGTPLAGS